MKKINGTLCHATLSTTDEDLYDDTYSDVIEVDIEFLDGPLKGHFASRFFKKAKLRDAIYKNKEDK